MWRKIAHLSRPQINPNILPDDFKSLLLYIDQLANNKMGYPVSLLTFLGIVDNRILGIKPGTLANVLLNNVGDPFKDSLTSLMEVKGFERKLIAILEKYYGMQKNEARGYVTTGGTEGNFGALWWSKRYLINCALQQLIQQDDALKLQATEEQELISALSKIPLNQYRERMEHLQKIIDARNTIVAGKNHLQQLLTPTVFYSKGHTHYSIPKISEILHLNTRPLIANPDGSIDLKNFKKELIFHLGAHPHSSIIVVTNIGTTITGAIDDLPGIKKILDEAPQKPTYTIHMDGALTGFVLPILKPFGDIPNYFEHLGVNTLAVSAHKYPGLSQPCGILLARRPFFEKAFEKSERSIDYVGDILDVTITGSRSGLNVLMFYNALCTLGLDKGTQKLRLMVQENLRNAKYLYEQLVKIYGVEHVSYPYHFNVMFPKPSMNMARKYQLMLTGGNATICVLSNVTKTLIDQFIRDLKIDKEEVMKTITKDHFITTLQAEHLESAKELFVKVFCFNEPVTRYLGIEPDDYEPFAEAALKKAIQDGMSKVALDKKNQVIAFVIAEDLANPFKPELSLYPRMKPVLGLLNELSRPFLAGKRFVKGKIAHFWLAGVEQELMGKGLFKKVNNELIQDLIQKGYTLAYSEFTNEISAKEALHFKNLELCNKIRYDSFVMDGQKPFQGLKGEAVAYVAAIKPGVQLTSLKDCYILEESPILS